MIQAYNDDMPYDMFVKAQIAGDLLDPKLRYKMLPATGFFGLGPWYFDNGAVEVTRADERHDRVDVVTRGFLGLTVACARCHNHKYDPIPQTDYYSLAGVFADTVYHEYPRDPEVGAGRVHEGSGAGGEEAEDAAGDADEPVDGPGGIAGAAHVGLPAGGLGSTGSQKKEKANVVDEKKLDYELLDRWIHYMEKPTDKYHAKDAWQAMMKKGGNAAAGEETGGRIPGFGDEGDARPAGSE